MEGSGSSVVGDGERIGEMRAGQVFVFGSNEQGIHGAGAAKQARQSFGAEIGVGEGPTGRCYALPTRYVSGRTFISLTLPQIAVNVERFLVYASAHPESEFLMTKVGCGLAGHSESSMAALFATAPANVVLPNGWTRKNDSA